MFGTSVWLLKVGLFGLITEDWRGGWCWSRQPWREVWTFSVYRWKSSGSMSRSCLQKYQWLTYSNMTLLGGSVRTSGENSHVNNQESWIYMKQISLLWLEVVKQFNVDNLQAEKIHSQRRGMLLTCWCRHSWCSLWSFWGYCLENLHNRRSLQLVLMEISQLMRDVSSPACLCHPPAENTCSEQPNILSVWLSVVVIPSWSW